MSLYVLETYMKFQQNNSSEFQNFWKFPFSFNFDIHIFETNCKPFRTYKIFVLNFKKCKE